MPASGAADTRQRHTEAVPAAGGVLKDCFPLFIANDGYTKQEGDGEATATCFCGAVQYAFVSFCAPLFTSSIKIATPRKLADMYF